MTVRAKMKCTSKEEHGNGFKISLEPVTSGSLENDRFYLLTPAGNCMLSTINPEAARAFDANGEYYLDFSRADAEVAFIPPAAQGATESDPQPKVVSRPELQSADTTPVNRTALNEVLAAADARLDDEDSQMTEEEKARLKLAIQELRHERLDVDSQERRAMGEEPGESRS